MNKLTPTPKSTSEIIADVLAAVGLNAPTFAKKIGISYQRIFNLQCGRTKNFNNEIIAAITEAFPQISRSYLYTGEGSVTNQLVSLGPIDERTTAVVTPISAAQMLNRCIDILQEITNRERMLNEREARLIERERAIAEKLNPTTPPAQ